MADDIFDSAMRQAGVLRMFSVDELIRTLRGFLSMPLPTGPSMAFVTYSGAQAIMSIDAAMDEGLTVARLGDGTRERIGRVIATASKLKNPIDIFPDMQIHGFEKTVLEILTALMDDDGVNGIIFVSGASHGIEPYRPVVAALKERCTKPVFFSLLGAKQDFQAIQAFLEENGFPCFEIPEMAVRVFSRMWQYARRKHDGE